MLKKLLLTLLLVSTLFAGTEDNYVPIEYDCDGVITEFTFSFPIGETSDLEVILKLTATEVEEILTENTDYTVSATNNDYSSGGSVKTITAYANTYTLIIRRETAKSQDAIFVDAGKLRVKAIEGGLDKLTRLVQDLQEIVGRCLKIPKSETSTVMLPTITNRADKNLTSGGDGNISFTSLLNTGTANISDFGETLIDDVDVIAARGTLGLDTDDDVEFAGITGTTIVGTTGTFSGAIAGTTGTFSGAIAGTTGTLTDIITKGPWVDVRAYGTHTTDIGNSINLALAALPATGGRIILPASATAFPQTTAISITKPCEIVGMGRGATTIEKQGNIVGITINDARGIAPSLEGHVVLRGFALDSAGGADASNGITITEFMDGIIDDVAVINQGAHGIEFKKGNVSHFSNLFLSKNAGDGFKIDASDVNCNACVFTNIDTISNTGWGFNVNAGNDNWFFGITSQYNGNGIRINSYGNVLYGYAENNTGEEIELTAAAKSNTVYCILPTTVTVGNVFNLVYDRAGGQDRVFVRQGHFIGGLSCGHANLADAGFIILWEGAGGNTPGYIKIHSPDGTVWYLFVEDDGTVKAHNAVPTLNADGSAVGDQTD